jgi:L,D-transpeptidase catalytic domain
MNIDKSQQKRTVFVDGVEKYTWPVSTGRRGYSTPSGTYTPTSMNEVWYSQQWDNSPMPHSIFFMKDGHAIHGSYEVKTLGKPVSHGCVRVSPANAAILYALVKETGMKNVQVVLTGTTPGGEAVVASQPAYPRYGKRLHGPGPDRTTIHRRDEAFSADCSSHMTVLRAIIGPAAITPQVISTCRGLRLRNSSHRYRGRGARNWRAGIRACPWCR